MTKICVLAFAFLVASVRAWTLPAPCLANQNNHRRNEKRHVATTALHLFYKPPSAKVASTRRLFVTESIEKDWADGTVDFPYTFPVTVGKQPLFTTSRAAAENATLTIRLMEWKDLPQIEDMCVKEYSTYSVPTIDDSTSPLDKFIHWLDQASLGPYVKLSMVLKLWLDYSSKQQTLPLDHVILVASICQSNKQEQLVGMVEVSRQPPIPQRNPPAIPFPLWLKEGYCRFFMNNQTTQGWITNLLIVPEFRGRGWAKALVLACEGVARSWGTQAIHLHCDASYRTPQKLYRSLGYKPASSTSQYSWMSNNDYCESSIHVIDGVPLLHLCKEI